MTDEQPYQALFLCTGNSARSIMAEALLNHWGRGEFRAYSAGTHPKGAVHPVALALLRHMSLPTEGLRSKSWDEFTKPEAPVLDFVFTVCDRAAGESCPIWPGDPLTAHWGVPDPALVSGSDAEIWAAFRDVFHALERHVKVFTSLPHASLDRIRLQQHLEDIGRTAREVGTPA
jgi:arsenate reductase (thioredoxin)